MYRGLIEDNTKVKVIIEHDSCKYAFESEPIKIRNRVDEKIKLLLCIDDKDIDVEKCKEPLSIEELAQITRNRDFKVIIIATGIACTTILIVYIMAMFIR